jgi:hypothetical protein
MSWLYNLNYFGPDRRGKRFQARFFDRRRAADNGDRATLRDAMRERGAPLSWIDHLSYFGPDRRSATFSHYILERRKDNYAGAPPTLQNALRQLRVRVLEAEDSKARAMYKDRLIATALLADTKDEAAIGDELLSLVDMLEMRDAGSHLQSELLRLEALLNNRAA